MTQRTLFGWAILGLACFSATSFAQAPPPGPYAVNHGARIITSADGAVCRPFETGYRCRQFVVQRQRLPDGQDGATSARVEYWGGTAEGYYWRTIECTVDRGVLRVNAVGAIVDAVLDPTAAGCFTDGERVTNEPYASERWPFVSPVVLQVTMLDPGIENRWVTHNTQLYREDGLTAREVCRGRNAYRLRDGELRVGAIGEVTVTGQFSAEDTEGSFYDERCESIDRTTAE